MKLDKTAIITAAISGIFGLISSTTTMLLNFYLTSSSAPVPEATKSGPQVEQSLSGVAEVVEETSSSMAIEPWLATLIIVGVTIVMAAAAFGIVHGTKVMLAKRRGEV
ncbi:MAG: hypothetical protein LC687_04785 [Actinobacteria bacterium]|nr:hypothetical protein [Actinomycetota bacterium]MCA1807150.1 hypothetical protein [Actinomycetota bacterium]